MAKSRGKNTPETKEVAAVAGEAEAGQKFGEETGAVTDTERALQAAAIEQSNAVHEANTAVTDPEPKPEDESEGEGEGGAETEGETEGENAGKSAVRILDAEDVQEANMVELTEFYNLFSKRKVKSFPDIPTARKKVLDLLKKLPANPVAPEPKAPEVPLTPEQLAEKAAQIQANRSQGTARSWQNAEIKAKRQERHGVEVNGEYFASVEKAYRHYNLPLTKMIAHRIDLKNEFRKNPEYVDEEFGMTWKVVPYRAVEKKKAAPASPATAPAPEANATAEGQAVETQNAEGGAPS